MERICSECGAHFEGYSRDIRCPKCRKIHHKIARTNVCKDCGEPYQTYGPRSYYCPDCKQERKRKSWAEQHRRARAGKNRTLGSTDFCEICGAEYTVKSGLQKYCPECQRKKISERSMSYYNRVGAEKRDKRVKSRSIATGHCIVCGKPFPLDGNRDKCCSPECLEARKIQLQRIANDRRTKNDK